ncbi:MAG TPA: NADH-quinone oxidoreductase subunit J [Bacteroidia bacterium]|nr:NADH-quinone oxidoreductase subunit J [Bacteroidia bacterium]HNT80878.1 NADH-quinone oxidoreductase subunit J [Bacteroidia bacterium]
MVQYAFYILAFLSVLSALLVVFSKQPVRSVLYLIFCFFTIAGHYILLNAQFLAAVHIIVYAGAILVLFLFVIMLLNLNRDTEPQKSNLIRVAAVIASGCLLLVLTSALKGAESIPLQMSEGSVGLVKNLGRVLYTDYMLPFEMASVLLLAAMVGVVFLTKKEVDQK